MTMLRSLKIIISLALLLGATAVIAEPVVNYTYHYYTATAKHASELRAALNEASPVHEDGRAFHAYTKWYVNWHFYWNRREASCEMTSVSTDVAVDYTLPQFQPAAGADADVQQRFDNYYRALFTHEQGHAQHGIDAAHEVERSLMQMAGWSCDTITEDANRRAREILGKYNRMDVDYDRDTEHGRTQGAVLP